jgi:hypothetical protein
VPPASPDDRRLIADRLRLGIPIHGFDGRVIPLRTDEGEVSLIGAAYEVLESALALHDEEIAHELMDAALSRAWAVEAAALADGIPTEGTHRRLVAVLVSAAVRANVLAAGREVDPSAVNRATLAWFEGTRQRSLAMEVALGSDYALRSA